jgi:hypothetical protein
MISFAAAACTTVARKPPPDAPRVLGEQTGTPTVIGQPAPAGTGQLGAVSCADATHCWAVGVAGPNAAASPTAPVTVIAATANGGRTWAAQHLTLPITPDLSDVSCPALTTCMAVGASGAQPASGLALTTQDGGATWAPATVPPGAADLTSVTCATTTACTAIVSDGTATWSAQTNDFGATWVREGNLPLAFEDPRTISCTFGGSCLVAGYSGTTTGHGQADIALSVNGGQTWTASILPPGLGALQSATCPTATTCLAVGSTSTTVSDVVPAQGLLLTSSDGGHTWAVSLATPPVDDVFGVACPTTLVCAMVGTLWTGTPAVGTGAVALSADGGVTFTGSKAAYVPLSLTALSCPSARGCVAVGGDIVARIVLPVPKVHKKRAAGTTTGAS